MPPPNTLLWWKDSFKRKALRKQPLPEGYCDYHPSFLPESRRWSPHVKHALPTPGEKEHSYPQRWGAEAKRILYTQTLLSSRVPCCRLGSWPLGSSLPFTSTLTPSWGSGVRVWCCLHLLLPLGRLQSPEYILVPVVDWNLRALVWMSQPLQRNEVRSIFYKRKERCWLWWTRCFFLPPSLLKL